MVALEAGMTNNWADPTRAVTNKLIQVIQQTYPVLKFVLGIIFECLPEELLVNEHEIESEFQEFVKTQLKFVIFLPNVQKDKAIKVLEQIKIDFGSRCGLKNKKSSKTDPKLLQLLDQVSDDILENTFILVPEKLENSHVLPVCLSVDKDLKVTETGHEAYTWLFSSGAAETGETGTSVYSATGKHRLFILITHTIL